jgi:primosomal protein N''
MHLADQVVEDTVEADQAATAMAVVEVMVVATVAEEVMAEIVAIAREVAAVEVTVEIAQAVENVADILNREMRKQVAQAVQEEATATEVVDATATKVKIHQTNY